MKILKTHTYSSGNVLEIAATDEWFDISFYHNQWKPQPDYDRWTFDTEREVNHLFTKLAAHDDIDLFSDTCVKMGGI